MLVPLRDKTGAIVAHAIIDASDVLLVLGYRWYLDRDAKGEPTYATTYVTANHKQRMHRIILGYKPGDPEVDHANGNKLDNRRRNLRGATRSQNVGNSKPHRQRSSRYKGVSWHKASGKWMAQCYAKENQDRGYLGLFTTEEEAARAYDKAAWAVWGEFAHLNFPNERTPNA